MASTRRTQEAIIEGFKQYKRVPDIICLNEVSVSPSESLNFLAKGFGRLAGIEEAYHIHFYGHIRGIFGNAILLNPCSVRLVQESKSLLPGGVKIVVKPGEKKLNGSTRDDTKTHRIVRGLIKLKLEVFNGLEIEVACTHLDHISEKERKVQLSYILNEELKDSKIIQILVGDLNSLERSDYSNEEWEVLENFHQQQGWTPPVFGELQLLEEKGFVDTFRKYHKNTVVKLPGMKKFTSSVTFPKHRIDYIFASNPCIEKLDIIEAFVGDLIECSDHYPLFVDFAVKPEIKL